MSFLSANGAPVGQARLVFPLTGAWHADLYLSTAPGLTGAVSLDVAGDLTLTGTVLTGSAYVEALYLRVIAGKGGWVKACAAKFYQNATLGMILAEALRQGGDSLSTTTPASVRNIVLSAFSVTTATVGANVRALMSYAPAGTSYRFLPDGTFWAGPETWPVFAKGYQVTSEEPREQRLQIGFESPTLIAGQTVQAESGTVRVNRVETAIAPTGFHARAWWQA